MLRATANGQRVQVDCAPAREEAAVDYLMTEISAGCSADTLTTSVMTNRHPSINQMLRQNRRESPSINQVVHQSRVDLVDQSMNRNRELPGNVLGV